jgi:hypothetical protein
MDTTAIATAVSQDLTFGTLAGMALCLLAICIGLALLWHGWPSFKKK